MERFKSVIFAFLLLTASMLVMTGFASSAWPATDPAGLPGNRTVTQNCCPSQPAGCLPA